MNLIIVDQSLACSVTTPDASTVGLQSSDEQLIPQFVQLAHQNVGVSCKLSLISTEIMLRMSMPYYLSVDGPDHNTFLPQYRRIRIAQCLLKLS